MAMTHEQLNITEPEMQALLTVRNGLASGEYVHAPSIHFNPNPLRRGFNMSTIHCGSAGCIGGWMAHTMLKNTSNRMISNYVVKYTTAVEGPKASRALLPLFYPDDEEDHGVWAQITTEDAVVAIDNFLATGEPKWNAIIEAQGYEPANEEDDE